jgi:2-isopropylmalate synthase
MTTSSNKLIILDTTLRDGEQSPGILLSPQDKLTIALQLEKLGVDVIEAGFAASSKDSFTAIETIAHNITDSTICSLARAKESDIQCALEALKSARSKRIHIFIATSDIHIEKKLHTTQEHVLEQAVHAVQYARQYTDDIQFCAEDAYRSSQDFLCTIIEAVIKAGATTINIPDTVGYALPELYGAYIHELRQRIPCSD